MALFYPSMIAHVAEEAGMKVPNFSKKRPKAKRIDDFDPNAYPHFFVFCEVTLGRAIRWASWHGWARANAEVIAKLDEDTVKKVTLGNLVDLGVDLNCM